MGQRGKPALSLLLQSLEDASTAIRTSVVNAISKTRDASPQTIEALKQCWTSADDSLRLLIEITVEELSGQEFNPTGRRRGGGNIDRGEAAADDPIYHGGAWTIK